MCIAGSRLWWIAMGDVESLHCKSVHHGCCSKTAGSQLQPTDPHHQHPAQLSASQPGLPCSCWPPGGQQVPARSAPLRLSEQHHIALMSRLLGFTGAGCLLLLVQRTACQPRSPAHARIEPGPQPRHVAPAFTRTSTEWSNFSAPSPSKPRAAALRASTRVTVPPPSRCQQSVSGSAVSASI